MSDTATSDPAPEAEEAAEPGQDLAMLVSTVVAKVNSGSLNYRDLLDALAPKAPEIPPPTLIPLPAQITDEQKAALARVEEVFGTVVPTDRRMLQPLEVSSLLDERQVLDTVAKMAGDRKDDIRTIVLNHRDVAIEDEFDEGDRAKFRRDKDGHYIVKGEVRGTPHDAERFSAEPRAGSVSISVEMLEALEGDEELEKLMGAPFTHDDFLALTRSVRMADEAKTMLALRKKPMLVHALRKASQRGTPSIAVAPRKA